MSPYIVAGYVIALSVLTVYATTLVVRVRAARRRLRVVDAAERAVKARHEGTGGAADAP